MTEEEPRPGDIIAINTRPQSLYIVIGDVGPMKFILCYIGAPISISMTSYKALNTKYFDSTITEVSDIP